MNAFPHVSFPLCLADFVLYAPTAFRLYSGPVYTGDSIAFMLQCRIISRWRETLENDLINYSSAPEE